MRRGGWISPPGPPETHPGGTRHLGELAELLYHPPDVVGELLGVAVVGGELLLQFGTDEGQVDGVVVLLGRGGVRDPRVGGCEGFLSPPNLPWIPCGTHQGAGEAVEGPAGLVAKQLQQHVLTFLQGCKEIPRSLCAPSDTPDLPPKQHPPPQYVPAGPGGRVCGAAPPRSHQRRPHWGVAGPGTANTSTRGCGIEQRDRVEGSSVSLSACSLWGGKSPPCPGMEPGGPQVSGIKERGSHRDQGQWIPQDFGSAGQFPHGSGPSSPGSRGGVRNGEGDTSSPGIKEVPTGPRSMLRGVEPQGIRVAV